MWVQWRISEVCNGGIFGGLLIDFCVGQILQVRTENGGGDDKPIFLIVKYLPRKILSITYGLTLGVSLLIGKG